MTDQDDCPVVPLDVDDRTRERLDAMLGVTTLDFAAMVRAAGLDPKTAFRGRVLRDIDFGDSDLSEFDFTGTEFVNCKKVGLENCIQDFKVLFVAFDWGDEYFMECISRIKKDVAALFPISFNDYPVYSHPRQLFLPIGGFDNRVSASNCILLIVILSSGYYKHSSFQLKTIFSFIYELLMSRSRDKLLHVQVYQDSRIIDYPDTFYGSYRVKRIRQIIADAELANPVLWEKYDNNPRLADVIVSNIIQLRSKIFHDPD